MSTSLEKGLLVTILSFDGGGTRGLLPAPVPDEIRRRLETTGLRRKLAGHFEPVARNTTVAVIAPAITVTDRAGDLRYTLVDILEPYDPRGTAVFPVSFRSVFQTAVQELGFKCAPSGICRLPARPLRTGRLVQQRHSRRGPGGGVADEKKISASAYSLVRLSHIW